MLDSTTTTMKRSFKKRSMVALADSASDEPFERLVAPHPPERYQICMTLDGAESAEGLGAMSFAQSALVGEVTDD